MQPAPKHCGADHGCLHSIKPLPAAEAACLACFTLQQNAASKCLLLAVAVVCPLLSRHVGGGREEEAQPLDVDYGHVHLEVKQLDMVLEV